MSSYLRAAGGMRRASLGSGYRCITHRSCPEKSSLKARISFDLHGCVTWMSMPLTALEPLDRSWQPARFVVLDDLRLQVDRVERRSLAGCRLHNLGSGQQAAAGPRWRGGSARIASANELSCSERATMWLAVSRHPRHLPACRETAN